MNLCNAVADPGKITETTERIAVDGTRTVTVDTTKILEDSTIEKIESRRQGGQQKEQVAPVEQTAETTEEKPAEVVQKTDVPVVVVTTEEAVPPRYEHYSILQYGMCCLSYIFVISLSYRMLNTVLQV